MRGEEAAAEEDRSGVKKGDTESAVEDGKAAAKKRDKEAAAEEVCEVLMRGDEV